MLGSHENLGLQASFRGQDYKYQAVSGLNHNKTLVICPVHSLLFNSSASRDSRARDTIYTSHLCSIKVQGRGSSARKEKEREVRLDNQIKKHLLSKYWYEYYICKAFLVWFLSTSANLRPTGEWGEMRRNTEKKTGFCLDVALWYLMLGLLCDRGAWSEKSSQSGFLPDHEIETKMKYVIAIFI